MADKGSNRITFAGAEVKKLSVKKLVSLDKSYELVLHTADQSVLLADAFAPDTTFTVVMEAE